METIYICKLVHKLAIFISYLPVEDHSLVTENLSN